MPARSSASWYRRASIQTRRRYAAAELTWALVLAAMRQVPQQNVRAQGGRVADWRRQQPARQDAGNLRLRQDRQRRRGLRQGVRDECIGLGARGVTRARAKPTATWHGAE